VTKSGPEPPRGSGPAFFRRRRVVVAAIIVALFVVGPLIATWAIQRFVTFPRPPDGGWNPRARTDNGGEQLWLDVDGDRVEAWYLPPDHAGYGRSLGGGAIAQLAARRKLVALVLESTFYNFEEVVTGYGVPRLLLINHFDTGAVIRRYTGPLLVMHGTRDRVFTSENAEKLAAASDHSTLHLDACGHNDCPRHWDLVLRFLADNGVCRKPDTESSNETISVC
jgi:fermentation-respiration switch protein FrsA (DUF1100 family)